MGNEDKNPANDSGESPRPAPERDSNLSLARWPAEWFTPERLSRVSTTRLIEYLMSEGLRGNRSALRRQSRAWLIQEVIEESKSARNEA